MNDYWLCLLEYFNTRELAVGIWLIFIAALVLYRKETRLSLFDVFRTIFNWKLLVMFGSFAAYIAGLCWLLSGFYLWDTGQLPATALWFFLTGVVLLGRSLSVKENEDYFSKLIWDSFKVAGVFEFVVVAYTFNLKVELLLVPLLALLGAMIVVAELKEEHRQAKRLLETVLIIIVFVILWNSASHIWHAPEVFFTTQNGRNFILPALLTIGCIPIFYIWYCYSHIEGAQIQIELKTFQSDELKQYAKRRFFSTFFIKPWLLRRATRQFHILPAKSNEDVDEIIKEIQIQERQAKNPPAIDDKNGWSPYLARDFLKEYGLQTDDYHAGYDGEEWWAGSLYVDLDNHILPNTTAFYLDGQRKLVTALKLKGHFRDDFDPSKGLEKFRTIALHLVEQALGISASEAASAISESMQFELTLVGTKISSKSERYPNEEGFEQYFVLSRS